MKAMDALPANNHTQSGRVVCLQCYEPLTPSLYPSVRTLALLALYEKLFFGVQAGSHFAIPGVALSLKASDSGKGSQHNKCTLSRMMERKENF